MRKTGFLPALLLLAAPALSHAAPPDSAAPPTAEKAALGSQSAPANGAIDVSGIADKLQIFTDGKKHFVALVPFGDLFENLYYGDGKTFYSQRVIGGGSSGTESFNRVFWDPRLPQGYKRSVDFKDSKFQVQCDERITAMKAVPNGEAKALVKGAKFLPARWTHRAYALARDEHGNYYYVDRLREPEGNKVFRLFAGPKGKMKQQKMTNVVSDSEGDMFATRTGQLRLILNKGESTWIAGKSKTKLLLVPPEDNGPMIYTELGVYEGQPLGTPCDDL